MIERIIDSFLSKLGYLLNTIWGWIAGLGLAILSAIGDHKLAVGFVVVVVLLDAVWGIAASVSQKKFAVSELTRDTFAKLIVYGTVIIIFCFLDRLFGEGVTLTTAAICGAIMLVELWSIAGNALIVFPHMPFLRLLRPALTGEIASKLHIDPDKVKDTLEEISEQRKKKNGKTQS